MKDGLTGLVLTGGGARGAYQAGALRAIAEITGEGPLPFPLLAGSSAGSINIAFLASRADDFTRATRELTALWNTIEPRLVFRTDPQSIARTAVEWIGDLGFGGRFHAGREKALLDTSPLRALLNSELDMDAIAGHVARGLLRGVGVTATNYESGLGVTFFEGAPEIEPWSRVTRVGVRASLRLEHVLASCAIPIFFPAVAIGGDWYADGSIRLHTPLSPAIRMGAARLVAIAVRRELAAAPPVASSTVQPYPTLADAGGTLLDALFLDALDSDEERTRRINQTLRFLSPELLGRQAFPLRTIELLVLRPSRDLGEFVLGAVDRFPAALRHMFRGLGASDDTGWDLLSYLAFDAAYTARLCELGYEDTRVRAAEIAAFLSGEAPVTRGLAPTR